MNSLENNKISVTKDEVDSSNSNNVLTSPQTNEENTIKTENKQTYLSVTSTSVVNGKNLNIHLKNSAGIGISGQKISITFNNKKYTKTTNANGHIKLKMNYKATKYYPVKVKYTESTSYLSTTNSFKVKVYKLKTKLTIKSKTIIRGKYMYIFLKDSNGNALSSKKVIIKFNKKSFKKYTNNNGQATLKIVSKAGKYPVKITYSGSTRYLSSSKSFTVTSCLDKIKITVFNSQIQKGNHLYVYLNSNSNNKALSNKKVIITFNNKKYIRTTNSNGRISLKIDAPANNYKTIIKYSGSNYYKASSITVNINVISKTSTQIVATSKVSSSNAQSIGSGIPITKKTIVLDSDNIYNKATDTKLLDDIASILKSTGYNVIVNYNINPNAHCSDIMGKYSDVCVFCIFGGVDSGMFVDMSAKWYQNYLKKYSNEVVLGFTRTTRNIATETWLERAHDDNYSPSSFTGLANPGTYLNTNGFDYVYGDTASQLAENFLKYAINGLSIGR